MALMQVGLDGGMRHGHFGLCVMSNHVHDLIRPARPGEMPRLMPWLNWHGAMQRHRQSGCISRECHRHGCSCSWRRCPPGFRMLADRGPSLIGMIVRSKKGRAMTELELKTEAEAAEFTDELTDEALDRTEGEFFFLTYLG